MRRSPASGGPLRTPASPARPLAARQGAESQSYHARRIREMSSLPATAGAARNLCQSFSELGRKRCFAWKAAL